MKTNLSILGLAAVAFLQYGCGISSPLTQTTNAGTSIDMAMLGLGATAGALVGDGINDSWGAPAFAAVGAASAMAYNNHVKAREAQLTAEAKEEGRREERAILMRDYWFEATGGEYRADYNGLERDIRYDAGVYDGVRYETRNLPRQLYFQEPPR